MTDDYSKLEARLRSEYPTWHHGHKAADAIAALRKERGELETSRDRGLERLVKQARKLDTAEARIATLTAERDAALTTVASLADERRQAVEALRYVDDCYSAAETEGLSGRLAEQKNTDIGSLHDLITRRLLYAFERARATLAQMELVAYHGAAENIHLGAVQPPDMVLADSVHRTIEGSCAMAAIDGTIIRRFLP